jgi:septal ring factor EnvC (AmiA/AmiB activator)
MRASQAARFGQEKPHETQAPRTRADHPQAAHRWQQLYSGMKATEAKRLKELEQENARLKRLLADAELDKAMLKELAEGNS